MILHYSIDESTLTIEHILPQNPNAFGENYDLFVKRIGHTALVSNAENKELDQKLFAEKQRILLKKAMIL